MKTSRGKILLPDIVDGPSVGPRAGTVSCCILAPAIIRWPPPVHYSGRASKQLQHYYNIITARSRHSDMQAYTQNILPGE